MLTDPNGSNHNLLVAFLALQNQFVSRQDLLSAAVQCHSQPALPIGEILCQQQRLTIAQRALLEQLAAEYLKKHHHDFDKCYASLTGIDSRAKLLEELASFHQELSRLQLGSDDPAGTLPFDQPRMAGAARSENGTSASRSRSDSRFVLLRPHAEGGLGRVYVARDQELNREVALKEIRPEYADHEASRTRFLIEAEITGRLEHPGIVPIYSCGTHHDGRPFYAMRFIRGVSLKDGIADFYQHQEIHCETNAKETSTDPKSISRIPAHAFHSLEFRQLLNKFVAVCYAMSYAHSRGVLHRDLKPANIMLGDYGETLVVDWGLAKATGMTDSLDPLSGAAQPALTASSDSASDPTSMGSTLGTLGYMSPEQASGRIDLFGPATDIYLLGATLYQLLTGQAPHRVSGKREALKRIQKNDFPSPRSLNPAIPRTLEAICLKAMSTEISDRYGSDRDLAGDLEAYLADEPVQACPDRLVDRVWRWTRRHRSWAISGVPWPTLIAVIAVVAAFSIRAAQQRTEGQRQVAIARLRDAREAVDTWQTGTSELLRYYPGVRNARVKLLSQAVVSYDKFAGQVTDDDDLELERARAYVRRGDIERSLQKPAAALATYESSQALLAQLRKRNPNRWEIALDLVRIDSKRALAWADQGKLTEAIDSLQAGIEKLSSINVPLQGHREANEIQAILLLNCGRLKINQGMRTEAEDQLQRARRLFKESVQSNTANSKIHRNLVATEILLGEIAQDRGDASQALGLFAAAIRALDQLVAQEQDQPDLWQTRAIARIYHAAACRSLGRPQDEQNDYQAAISDYAALMRAIPDDPQYLDSQALTELDLAQLSWHQGRATEAVALARTAHEHFAGRHRQNPDWLEYRMQLAAAAAICGQMENDLGNLDTARELLLEAKQELDSLVTEHPDVPEYKERRAIAESQLALCLAKTGQIDEARNHLKSSLEVLTTLASLNPDVSRYRFDLAHASSTAARVELLADNASNAKPHFETARTMWKNLIRANADVEHLCDAAWFFCTCPITELRDPQLAKEAAVLSIAKTEYHPQVWQVQGLSSLRAKEPAEAIKSLQRAIALRQHPQAYDWLFMALAHHQLEQAIEARSALKKAETLAQEWQPDNSEMKQLLEETRTTIAD